jgi:hypothetical protein
MYKFIYYAAGAVLQTAHNTISICNAKNKCELIYSQCGTKNNY